MCMADEVRAVFSRVELDMRVGFFPPSACEHEQLYI